MRDRRFIPLVLGLSVLALAGCAPQQFVTLEDLLGTQPYPAVIDPREDTDAVCNQVDGCVEGWVSDDAEYMRFSSIDAATGHTETLGSDGFQTNFLVINWHSGVDPKQRQDVEELFAGAHQSE